jgi:hypothetical protein
VQHVLVEGYRFRRVPTVLDEQQHRWALSDAVVTAWMKLEMK